MLDQQSVVVGLVSGFLIAGVFAWTLQKIKMARNAMGAPDRNMSVQTTGTPRGVMAAAAAAFRTCLFWTAVLVIVGLLSVGFVYLLLTI